MTSFQNGIHICFRVEEDRMIRTKEIRTKNRIEDLNDDWQKLAEEKFGENSENRERLVKEFREKIREENLEEAAQLLCADS